MDTQQIVQLLRDGTPQQRIAFVRSCPENSFTDTTVSLLNTDSPEQIVIAMVPFIMEYCNGRDPETGAPLALAVHTYAQELFTPGVDSLLDPATLSNLAYQHVNALNLLGRSKEVIQFTDRFIPYYEKMGERKNLPSLKVARATALINLNNIDEAEALLYEPGIEGNFANDIELRRLRQLIIDIKKKIVDTRSQPAKPQNTGLGADPFKILKSAIESYADDPETRNDLLNALSNLDPQPSADINTPEGYQKLLDTLKRGEDFITRNTSGENEWTVKQKVRTASQIFTFGQKPPEPQIRQSISMLEEALEWAITNHHFELENDARWGLYLCHSRLNQPSDAADQLLEMRSNIEQRRAGIANPIERGGVFSTYPYLFHALVEKLCAAGRPGEMLEAIESSKGRGIADILTRNSGNIVADADVYGAVKKLPELTQEFNFHYLTYFVDDERTYAALVSRQGRIHTIGPIEISKQVISEASRHVDPAEWGEPRFDDPSQTIHNVAEVLSPLVEALGSLCEEKVITPGDHICYSADENFNNIPLHYLLLQGLPLIETCTVSKIQSAFHLEQLLSQPDPSNPEAFVSFIVPLQQDVDAAKWNTMKNHLEQPTEWLSSRYRGTIFRNEKAGMSQLQNTMLQNKIIQFSTHGIFPAHEELENSNPFRHSGLVLSDGLRLPDANEVGRGRLNSVLTPEKIMNMNLDFSGSHISLMACVSGLSREGLGGDALGMEWALIQAGASSILSSNWHVSAELAAEFIKQFYQHWLLEQESRAAAFSKTIQKIRQQPHLMSHSSNWAAFSLAGDWR